MCVPRPETTPAVHPPAPCPLTERRGAGGVGGLAWAARHSPSGEGPFRRHRGARSPAGPGPADSSTARSSLESRQGSLVPEPCEE